MSNAIEVRDLTKAYGEVQALDELSFAVPPGTVFGLLGPNGAGKSTTVKILTTLSHPDGGSASVAGLEILERPEGVRRAIGVVAQRSAVDREATVRENVRLQGQVNGLGSRELEARIDELLDRFGIADQGHRIARELSGGMERRLNVAMALVNHPRVLFLDEPTTGLDPEVRSDLWREISRLADEEGLTILLTTHYLEEADQLASRLAIVDRGRVVVEGSPEELKRELQGDAIHLELGSNGHDGDVQRALSRIEGVREVSVDGSALHARAEDGARAVPAVLQSLEANGITAASVTVARPSLDDVYLRYAGRTFGEAEAQTNEEVTR
jgi:ABC-2 type transport system ATP-binding protein